MKNYYRVMLDKGSTRVQECLSGNFICIGYLQHHDLTNKLPDEFRAFNREFIPIYLEDHPGKSRIAAGLACGAVWTVSKGINIGDIVLSPDGGGHYHIAEVIGNYYYQPDDIQLPHRRQVHWFSQTINRADMSDPLKSITGFQGTVTNISVYSEEIEKLIGGASGPQLISTDETVEDPSAFAMEQHLEEFLVQNWSHTELGKKYDIYEEDGDKVGQQYLTDTGPLDILAVSKDKKTLLVVELKKGRASDVVVGQILRYMGYVQEELAEKEQSVKGIIIALEDDQRIRRALTMTPAVEFYRYQVSFKLVKG
jgi:restriction system protein